MSWNPAVPYNELPSLPAAEVLETHRTLKAAIGARAALAGLDQACRRIPNPEVLVNSLPYIEAQASSEIENIVTTTDELLRFSQVADASASPATKEAYRYSRALFDGVDWIRHRPISTTLAEQICTTIHQRQMRIRTLPGTRIANPQTGAVVYSPPEGADRIRRMLAAWERFINEPAGIDPLIVMAAAHYQFEAIHPFADGNGRTGRILNVLAVVESGLLDSPVLYLSRYIIERKDEYYRLLLRVTTSRTGRTGFSSSSPASRRPLWRLSTLLRRSSRFTRRPCRSSPTQPQPDRMRSWPRRCAQIRTAASALSWSPALSPVRQRPTGCARS